MPAAPGRLPPAPWVLQGSGVISPWLVDAQVARGLVPRELEVVELLPGLTLGSVFALSYVDSPVGGYDEFGFAPALVQAEGQRGFYVSHLYVDSQRSVQAGRALWGLPKELADIVWRQDDHALRVEVQREKRALCLFETRQRGVALPAQVRVPLLTLLEGRLCCASIHLRARFAPGSSRLRVARGSPLKGLGLRLGLPTLWAWDAEMIVASDE